MWSNDIPSIVYTKMKIATNKKLENVYPGKYKVKYTRRAWDVSDAEFPTVSFQKLQGTERGADLDGNKVNAIVSNIQIDVITNTSLTDANIISDIITETMKSMCYQIAGDMYQDETNKSVYRIVARYRRTIAHDDVL